MMRTPPASPKASQSSLDDFFTKANTEVLDSPADPNRNPKRLRQSSPLEGEENVNISLILSAIRKMEFSMQSLDKKFDDLDRKLTARLDLFEKKIEDVCAEFSLLKSDLAELQDTSRKQDEEINKLRNEIDNLENRQRRDNLVFYNIPYTDSNETWNHCKEKLQEIALKVNIPNVNIDRAHRLGRSTTTRPAPIVARIPSTDQRSMLLSKWKDLKSLNVGISEDFSQLMRKKRSVLNAARKQAITEGKSAKIKFDRLIINGESFVCNKELSGVSKINNNKNFQ